MQYGATLGYGPLLKSLAAYLTTQHAGDYTYSVTDAETGPAHQGDFLVGPE